MKQTTAKRSTIKTKRSPTKTKSTPAPRSTAQAKSSSPQSRQNPAKPKPKIKPSPKPPATLRKYTGSPARPAKKTVWPPFPDRKGKAHKSTLAVTQLEYSVLPSSVYYTRDPLNPSMAVLTIGVSNTTDEEITLLGFQIKLPVSNNTKDRDALTSNPSSIIPVSMQPLAWDFQQFDDGVYRAEPIPPVNSLKARESITFQLQNVAINESDGAAILTIMENAGNGFPTVDKQVVKVKSSLEIKNFNANPVQVASGAASVLSWTTANAARVSLTPGDFPDIKPTDSVTVHPGTSTTYTLTAFGEGPSISLQRTIQISAPDIKSFTASATKVNAGDTVTLSWEVANASEIFINPGHYDNLPPKGTKDVPILNDTTFILTANNSGNELVNKPLTVSINPVSIDFFKATPGYGVRLGQTIELSWNMQSAVSATIQYGAINKIDAGKLKTGALDIVPNTGIAYSLIAQNALGNAIRSIELFPIPVGYTQFSTAAPFRFPEPPLVLHFDNNIFAMASNFMNSVFKTFDGSAWIPVTNDVPWPPRSFSAGTVFREKMWMMGGKTPDGSNLNDVWSSSDGAQWTRATQNAAWSPRNSFGCFTLPGIDKMFVIAGMDGSGSPLSDVWSSSDGASWTKEKDRAFDARSSFALANFDNKVWILGGKTTAATNEVWYSSDGRQWIAQSNIRWSARTYPCAAGLSGGLYLSGGLDSAGRAIYDMNKMSSGGSWTAPPGPSWSNQNILYTGYTEYQDALWFIGGATGTSITGTLKPNPNVWAYAP